MTRIDAFGNQKSVKFNKKRQIFKLLRA